MRTKTTLSNPILRRKISRKIVLNYSRTPSNPKMALNIQSIDLPRFDQETPDIFFGLFDRMMANAKITDDDTILHYMGIAIPQHIMALTLNDAYSALETKDKIVELRRLTVAECNKNKDEPYERASKLKKREDESEPDFLQRLMTITRSCSNKDELTRRCFLNNVSGMRFVMAKKELQEGKDIVEVAKNLHTYFPKKSDEINAIAMRSNKNHNEDIDDMKSQMKEMTEKFDSLQSMIAKSQDVPRRNWRNEDSFEPRQGRVQFREDYQGRSMRQQTPPCSRDYRSSRENTPTRGERVFYREQPHRYNNNYVNHDTQRDYYRQQNRSNSRYSNDGNRSYQGQNYRNNNYQNRDQGYYNHSRRSASNDRRNGSFSQNNAHTSNHNRQPRFNQDRQQNGVCYYHHRYGHEAIRCTSPCRMKNTNSKN